ncbi:MAG: ATP-binding protein [Mariprofundus sp.]|nr:ATP-binding protein [Mariprofundus sp.]
MLERRIQINNEADVVRTTLLIRHTLEAHCKASEAMLISTATSELATNLVRYAKGGFIRFTFDDVCRKISIESRDNGPGIVDIEQAMQEGYSSGKGLGAGLPAIKRIMDTMQIENSPQGGLRIWVQCKLKSSLI